MTQLTWDVLTDRTYETGVEKGVLYLPGVGIASKIFTGVPWSGLKSVKQTLSGGTQVPYTMDGIRTRQRYTREEFGLTIEAISYPKEFAKCDGTAWADGLGFGLQPRVPFGFSYRTKVGDATTGDLGYKLHLVYNAMAAPTEKAHSSLNATPEPTTFSWNVTTTPSNIPNRAPTAHLTIDSRHANPALLKVIEDRLYGTATTAPVLPTAREISDSFTSWKSAGVSVFYGSLDAITETVTNLAINPSFITGGGTLMLRNNLALNPNATTTTPGMTSNNSSIYPITMGVAITGHPMGITTAVKSTLAAGHAATSAYMSVYNIDNQGSTGSPARYLGAWFITTASGAQAGFQHDPASFTPLTPSSWKWVASTIPVPAGTYAMASVAKITGNTTSDADYAVMTGIVSDPNYPCVESIWGDRPAGDDKTYRWTGTPNGSVSVQEIVTPASTSESSARAIRSTVWTGTRANSLRLVALSLTDPRTSAIVGAIAPGNFQMQLQAGSTYTVMATRRLAAPITGTTDANYLGKILVTMTGGSAGAGQTIASDPAPNVAGTANIVFTFTIPADVTAAAVRLGHGGVYGSADVWWDNLTIISETPAKGYNGRSFDGGTAGYIYRRQNVTPKWDVPAWADYASTSSITYYKNLPFANPASGDAYSMGGYLYVYNVSTGLWVNCGPFLDAS